MSWENYGERRFGRGYPVPHLLRQHFNGAPAQWEGASIDAPATDLKLIMFSDKGCGRPTA